MSLLLISEDHDVQPWKEAISGIDGDIDIELWPAIQDPEKIQFAAAWGQPKHSLEKFPNLKVVSSLGAGVDHIINDETIPEDVEICRVVDESLSSQMSRYMHAAVLNYQLNTFDYNRQRLQRNWNPLSQKSSAAFTIGVMGLGEMGFPVAQNLAENGYQVVGWSNSEKDIAGIETFAGPDEKSDFLAQINVLICLLPLTEQTRDILDLKLFKQLKQPAYLINAGRGGQLVEEDLVYALDSGLLEGVQLDVFKEEPLPESHAFWNREKIIITPHIAAESIPASVAGQVVENYKRTLSGMPLLHKVEKERQY